jgi:hypothetical protein
LYIQRLFVCYFNNEFVSIIETEFAKWTKNNRSSNFINCIKCVCVIYTIMDPTHPQNKDEKPVKGGACMYGSTSDWGMAKFGQNQTANDSGSIVVKGGKPDVVVDNVEQDGGVGLTEAVVPVVLFLANNAVSKKLLSQSGLSAKQLKGGNLHSLPDGGSLANSIAVPAGLVLANNYLGKRLKSRRQLPSFGTRRPRFRNRKQMNSSTRRGKFRKNR